MGRHQPSSCPAPPRNSVLRMSVLNGKFFSKPPDTFLDKYQTIKKCVSFPQGHQIERKYKTQGYFLNLPLFNFMFQRINIQCQKLYDKNKNNISGSLIFLCKANQYNILRRYATQATSDHDPRLCQKEASKHENWNSVFITV